MQIRLVNELSQIAISCFCYSTLRAFYFRFLKIRMCYFRSNLMPDSVYLAIDTAVSIYSSISVALLHNSG